MNVKLIVNFNVNLKTVKNLSEEGKGSYELVEETLRAWTNNCISDLPITIDQKGKVIAVVNGYTVSILPN